MRKNLYYFVPNILFIVITFCCPSSAFPSTDLIESENKTYIAQLGNCGSSKFQRMAIRDSWGNADFSDDCLRHDKCYETIGFSKKYCDDQFTSGLRSSCKDSYASPWHLIQEKACLEIANTYHSAVNRMGGDAYREAQKEAKKKLSPINSRIRFRAIKNHNSCPLNGSFVRQLVWNSSNNNLAIRCSRAPNANINQSEYWTRPFMTINSNGSIKNIQSASCPDNRFVNEIIYRNNTFYIRCRYVNIAKTRGYWSVGKSYFTRPFLSSDLKNITGASCPDDSAMAQVLKLSDGRLAIRCRRIILDGRRLDIDESRYWTINFAKRGN